jgi:hypothetical protein
LEVVNTRESVLPGPRDFGCPVCYGKDSLIFESYVHDERANLICERDEWRGDLKSAIYEQSFVRKNEQRMLQNRIIVVLIVIAFLLSILAINASVSSPPEVILRVDASSINATANWTVLIISMRNATEIPMSDARLTVMNAEGVAIVSKVNLSRMTWGLFISGVNFTNRQPFDFLGVRDYFILDKGIFGEGSKIILDDNEGVHRYCSFKVVKK